MENLGVLSNSFIENSEVFFSEFSVLSVVQKGKLRVEKPRSLIKTPQRKSLRFSSASFRSWVWCKMENSEWKNVGKVFSEVSEISEISENSEFSTSPIENAIWGF